MVSKYKTFGGQRFELQFIATTKRNALREVKLRNSSPSFRMRNYRIVPVSAAKMDAERFSLVKTAYAIYGR